MDNLCSLQMYIQVESMYVFSGTAWLEYQSNDIGQRMCWLEEDAQSTQMSVMST